MSMDEDTDLPELADASDGDVDDRSAGRLIERLTELRLQLEILAPEDRDRSREAIETIRQAQERIASLEQMLGWAREREGELTTRLVRDQMKVAEVEARADELSAVAKIVSEAEAARLKAEADAAEWQHLLTVAQGELEAKKAEVRRLDSRCTDLEADLRTVTDELSSSAVARAKAERLERERNVARERARTERRLALEDRLRAADAEGQVAVLRRRLREVEQRLARSTSEGDAPSVEPDASSEPAQAGATTGPSIEPHDGRAEAEAEAASEGAPDLAEDESTEPDVVVDLTQEPHGSVDPEHPAEEFEADEVLVWTSPRKTGLVERLRRRLLVEEEPEEDDPERDPGAS